MKIGALFVQAERNQGLQFWYQSTSTYEERNGVADELRVFLHNFFDALLLNIFGLILFKVENDCGATSNGWACNSTNKCICQAQYF